MTIDKVSPFAIDSVKEVEKPPFLYHGSPNGDIKQFEPRIFPGNEQHGALVYASNNINISKIFMIGTTKRWATVLDEDRNPYVLISEDRESVLKNDKGGYLYTLKSKTFSNDDKRGMWDQEWASRVPVKPTKVEFYKSAIDEVLSNGTPIYFVNSEEITGILKADAPRYREILKRGLTSENERRGLNHIMSANK